MPKKQNTAAKKARAAAREGEKFTTALRRHETPAASAAELAALGVADAEKYAASFADKDDWDWDTRHARQQLRAVQWWEQMRAGREIRLWEAVIETRAAALDADDAWHRLALYMRHPVHRGGDMPLLYMHWEIGDPTEQELEERRHHREIAPLDPAALDAEEIRRLQADYPRDAFEHLDSRGTRYGAWEQAHVADYCANLGRAIEMIAAGRGLTDDDLGQWIAEVDAERGPLPDGVTLTYWSTHYRVEFLAGYDEASALERAEELAATIVNYAGRPVGRVVAGSLRPDDGFRNAIDGRWMHPSASGTSDLTAQSLWADYTLVDKRRSRGDRIGGRSVLIDLYLAARKQLRESFAQHAGEMAAHEAKLHTQPDGSRTYTSPGLMRQVTVKARAQAARKTPTELRQMAEHADYMARRVYGKAVDSDADMRRIEATEQQAKVWSQLADDIEAVTDLVGPGAVEWPLHGVTWQRTEGTDGPVLEIWAQTTDGDKDLVGLWLLGEDGRPTGPYHVVLQIRPGRPALTAPYPLGFVPPHPAKGAAAERTAWLGIKPE